MENKKLDLLIEICKWYDYKLTVDGKVLVDKDNSSEFSCESVDEGLKGWLETLEESNKCCIEEDVPLLWSQDTIDFIKSL